MTLAEKMKALRIERGLTQKELADRSGVPHRMVRGIECGEFERPAVDTVAALWKVIGCSGNSILEAALTAFKNKR